MVPNGRSAPAVLLRESYRDGKRVRKRTPANLGQLPPAMIDGLRVLLAGGTVVTRPGKVFEIHRALPHGNVATVARHDAQARSAVPAQPHGFARARPSAGDNRQPSHRAGVQTRDCAGAVAEDGKFQPGPLCWISASSRSGRSTPRWIDWLANRTPSSGRWHGGICRTARWYCTT